MLRALPGIENTMQLSTLKPFSLITQMVHLQSESLGLCSSIPMNWLLGFHEAQFLHLAPTH